MAIPVLVGRGAARPTASADVAGGASQPMRRFGHGYLWTVLALLIVALGSRIYTTNSLAGEPTSDEYLYAVHARDLARDWASGQSVSLEDLGVEGRSVAVESAALSFVLPWDPLTDGRTMQAFFNALCVPMTFVLGRQIGLTRSAAFVGALLLMAVPEFQEDAWRFWTDSQATFLCLVYLSALVAFIRRPAPVAGTLGLVCLGLLLLTKESAAVTFARQLKKLACRLRCGRRASAFRRSTWSPSPPRASPNWPESSSLPTAASSWSRTRALARRIRFREKSCQWCLPSISTKGVLTVRSTSSTELLHIRARVTPAASTAIATITSWH